MPRRRARELLLDQPETPTGRAVADKMRRMLPERRRKAGPKLREERQHPLTAPPAWGKAWIHPRHNAPRESSPYRRDAEIIIVHGRPVILRDRGEHSRAERTSALIAVEIANTKNVPVAAPHPDTDVRAREITFTISGLRITLSPDKEHGIRRSLLARGGTDPTGNRP